MWHAAHLPVALVLPVRHRLIDTAGKNPAVTAERHCVLIGALAAVIPHLGKCWILCFLVMCLVSGTASGDDISPKSIKIRQNSAKLSLLFICGDCHTPRRWLFGLSGQFGGHWFKHLYAGAKSALGRGLDERLCLLFVAARCVSRGSHIYSKVRCSFLQTTEASSSLGSFCRSGELERCSPSLQTEHPRRFKKSQMGLKWLQSSSTGRGPREGNNQHQLCQLSGLCLLGCSQLTQIQLLSKLNETV